MREILNKIIHFFILVSVCALPGVIFQVVDPERLGGYTAFGISFTIFVTALSLWPMLDKPRIRALFYGSVALAAGIFTAFIRYKVEQGTETELLSWVMWAGFIGGALSIAFYAYVNRDTPVTTAKEIVATIATTTGALISFILGIASAIGF